MLFRCALRDIRKVLDVLSLPLRRGRRRSILLPSAPCVRPVCLRPRHSIGRRKLFVAGVWSVMASFQRDCRLTRVMCGAGIVTNPPLAVIAD